MRWTLLVREMMRTEAYGQAVWSCPLDAGVKFAEMIGERRWLKSPRHRGEHGAAVNHCAGSAGCFGQPVVTTCSYAAYPFLRARLRVRPAPGIPCALFFKRDTEV